MCVCLGTAAEKYAIRNNESAKQMKINDSILAQEKEVPMFVGSTFNMKRIRRNQQFDYVTNVKHDSCLSGIANKLKKFHPILAFNLTSNTVLC